LFLTDCDRTGVDDPDEPDADVGSYAALGTPYPFNGAAPGNEEIDDAGGEVTGSGGTKWAAREKRVLRAVPGGDAAPKRVGGGGHATSALVMNGALDPLAIGACGWPFTTGWIGAEGRALRRRGRGGDAGVFAARWMDYAIWKVDVDVDVLAVGDKGVVDVTRRGGRV
jgi:hypothetical protein